jgi:hypothetical protein
MYHGNGEREGHATVFGRGGETGGQRVVRHDGAGEARNGDVSGIVGEQRKLGVGGRVADDPGDVKVGCGAVNRPLLATGIEPALKKGRELVLDVIRAPEVVIRGERMAPARVPFTKERQTGKKK